MVSVTHTGMRKGDTDSPSGPSQLQQKKDKKLLGDRFCQVRVHMVSLIICEE
jgi:hypothetical protein